MIGLTVSKRGGDHQESGRIVGPQQIDLQFAFDDRHSLDRKALGWRFGECSIFADDPIVSALTGGDLNVASSGVIVID
jgi:hypothetical protein